MALEDALELMFQERFNDFDRQLAGNSYTLARPSPSSPSVAKRSKVREELDTLSSVASAPSIPLTTHNESSTSGTPSLYPWRRFCFSY